MKPLGLSLLIIIGSWVLLVGLMYGAWNLGAAYGLAHPRTLQDATTTPTLQKD